MTRENVIVSLLLFVLIGPMFNPVPQSLLGALKLSAREISRWSLVGFLIPLIVIVLGVVLDKINIQSYIANKLKQLNTPAVSQVLFLCLLFALYHTAWDFNYGALIFTIIYGLVLSGLFVWGKPSLAPVLLFALIAGEPCLTIIMVPFV